MYSDEELKAMSLDELKKEFESAEKFRFFLNMKDHNPRLKSQACKSFY